MVKAALGVWRRRQAAAALVLAWLTLPITAQASPNTTVTLADSAVCTASLAIQLASPATPAATAAFTSVQYNANASMTCYGVTTTGVTTTQVSLTANGWTAIAPTCAQLVSANGTGSAFVGSSTYTINFGVAGATAAPLMVVFTPTPMVGPTALAIAGPLVLSTASLQACLQGGTTSLQYTGVLVLTS